jgi:hypothetical protein
MREGNKHFNVDEYILEITRGKTNKTYCQQID